MPLDGDPCAIGEAIAMALLADVQLRCSPEVAMGGAQQLPPRQAQTLAHCRRPLGSPFMGAVQ